MTGGFVVGAAVTGIVATNKRSQFDSANDGTDVDRAEELKNSGQTLNLVTDVLWGGAVVGAVITTVLYVTRPEVEQKESAIAWSPAALPPANSVLRKPELHRAGRPGGEYCR